jgi:hypothetical protein
VNGGTTPFNLQAPLYPLLLAVFARFDINLILAARVMNITLWTLFVFLCGWLFYRITGRQVEAFCFAVMCAFSAPLVADFSGLMTEPLALFLGIPGFLLLILAVTRRSTLWMVLAALMIGFSVLTRFAFAAVLVAGVLVVLLFSDLPWQRRWINTLIFGAIGIAPMGIFTIGQRIQRVTTGGRSLVFNEVSSKLHNFASLVWNTLKYWLPYRSNMIPGVSAKYFAPLLALALTALVGIGLLVFIRVERKGVFKDPTFILAVASMLFILAYFGVLLGGFAFSSVSNDINARILSPLLPALFALLVSSAILLGSGVKRPWLMHPIAVVVTLFFLFFNFDLLRTYGINSSKYPGGYASPYWYGSRIYESIERMPEGTPLASNAPDIILFYTNRMPYCLTENPTDRGNCLSAADRPHIQEFMENQCGVLILFPSSPTENYENYPDPISQGSMDGLKKLYPALIKADPGQILYWPECMDLKQSLDGR